jgi:hypothetical protein
MALGVGGLGLTELAGAHPYWFFNGYLPLGDGTRQVFKANVCCDIVNETRMSWDPLSGHPQRHVFIRRSDYGWEADTVWDYDSTYWYDTTYYVKAGCQNPYPYFATWTNRRVDLEGG